MAAVEHSSKGAPSMEKTNTDLNAVATIGLDLAKHVFQVHAIDAAGRVVISRAGRRAARHCPA